jgi:hypothetical protein
LILKSLTADGGTGVQRLTRLRTKMDQIRRPGPGGAVQGIVAPPVECSSSWVDSIFALR